MRMCFNNSLFIVYKFVFEMYLEVQEPHFHFSVPMVILYIIEI